MAGIQAFQSQSVTYAIAAAATAPTPTLISAGTPNLQPMNYAIQNAGTVWASVGMGSSPSIATSNATAPVPGTPNQTYLVAPGSTIVVRATANLYATAIASTAGTVYITAGEGSPI